MFVIAYFHYDTLKSSIQKFSDEDTAKKWLCERWKFLLDNDINEDLISLNELIDKLREVYVKIEIIQI